MVKSVWQKKYDKYLRSVTWKNIRNKVMIRDKNICQACLSKPARAVHHLSYATYNQTGFSPAYDLVAVCHGCHRRIHSK